MNKDFILKANLFEHGINVSPEAKIILNAQSDIWLMDDYITCSGVTLNYNNEYATVNVNPCSKIELLGNNGKLIILDGKNQVNASVIMPPDYMKNNIVINGKSITNYVNSYTDRIRLQTMNGCINNCKFCNANKYEYILNDIESIDKAFQIALEQGKNSVRHAFVSTNNVKDKDGLEQQTRTMEYFAAKYPEMNIDVMTSPRCFTSYADLSQYKQYLEHLKNTGIKGIATNMELHNKDKFKFFCPEKAIIGQENYLKFLEQAVEIFGEDHVRSMLILGLEPLEETLEGVTKLADRGVNPVLTPLFPYGEAQGDTSAELMIKAKTKCLEICVKKGVKMGPICKPCSHNTL